MKQSLICQLCCALIFGLWVASSPPDSAGQGRDAKLGEEQGDVTNIFLPAPRGLRQQLTRAQKALREEQYSEAVDLLGQLLAAPEIGDDSLNGVGEQDYFLGSTKRSGTEVSLKTEAQRLLGAMPDKGRELYELKFGADARQLLDSALETRDIQKLVEVTRRYFHTDAGYEAMMLIGRHYLDQGRPLAAALRLQRLEESTSATERYDPELSVLLATCWLLADMPDRARDTLAGLKSRAPDARLRVGDKTVSLFDLADKTLAESMLVEGGGRTATTEPTDRVITWLQQIIGPEFAAGLKEATQWAMFRGDATRNAESAGGTPLLNSRWRVQTANHPTDEELIRQGKKQFQERNVAAIPTINPLAVGEVIIMRTPRRVMGVDFQTGKRIWEFPWFEAPDEGVLQHDRIRPQQQALDPRAVELNQRMWDDSPYGQMSSDGKQLFVLWGLAAGTSQPSVIIQRLGIGRPNTTGAMESNKLVALELKAQGKLRWIVGDEDGTDEPKMAGAFFLGPPLPLMDQLFVLAEINGEIRLVVLDAETGRLQWSQQLAHVDARDIRNDPGRRSAGASPSFSDGVLVCPTSSGAVVAVDVATRSLLWGYQYPLAESPTRVSMARYHYAPKEIGDRWSDATVTIADGRVLVTPIESDRLYCLDLVSGELVWDQSRGDLLYTACVADSKAIMVGQKDIQAISLRDGKLAWTCDLPAGLPSGRGMLSGGHYYLPTTANRLLKFDLKKGDLIENVETDLTLGNLIAFQDQIISLNVDWLAAYYQTEPLRILVAERLKTAPDDAWALTRKAELLLHDGRHGEALDVFQQAYQLNPRDDSIRASLVRSLLSALRDNFAANQQHALELENLIDQPAEQLEFCRWMAVGLKEQGDIEKAAAYFIRLASMSVQAGFGADIDGPELVRVDDQLYVHRDRWLSVQVQQLLADAKGPTLEQIDQLILARYDELAQDQTVSKLRQFVAHFSSHRIGTQARLRLAQLLLERGNLLAAELELINLQDAEDPRLAATATTLLAELLLGNGNLREAATCYQRLADQWGDVATQSGSTGKELAAAARDHDAFRKQLVEPARWLQGKCEVSEEPRGSFPSYLRLFPIELSDVAGPFPTDHTLVFNQNQSSIVLSDAYGRTLQTILMGDANRFVTSNSAAGRAAARGHLVVVNVGFEVLAVDTLLGQDAQGDVVLWRSDISNSLMLNPRTSRQLMSNTINRKWGPPRFVPSEGRLGLIGMTGPITRHGVVYQKMRDLTCADPLSGQTCWVRNGVEPGSDIFGDDQFLFVVGPNSTEAIVLNTADGSEVGRRQVTSRGERWITSGRQVLSCRYDRQRLLLRSFDAWQQQDLWNREFDDGAQCWQPCRDEVAVFEPDGKFTVLKLADGQALVDIQLEPEPDLERLYVLSAHDSYTVVSSGQNRSRTSSRLRLFGSVGTDLCPEVNGHIYAIDRKTGTTLWPVPAEVREYNLPLDQPTEAPVLVFFRHTQTQASANSPRTTFKAAVLGVDKRDGRQLFSDDGLAMIRSYGMEATPADQKVTVRTNSKSFVLTFTDQPVEPASPVQIKAPETARSSALKNVGKIAGAILDAITEKEKQKAQPAPQEADPNDGAKKPVEQPDTKKKE